MNLENIFDEFGTTLKEDLQKSAIKHGIEYDGQESRLGASIVFQFKKDGAKFNLSMNDYWEVVNDGRGAGKTPPPADKLISWIKKRGLTVNISSKRTKLIKVVKNKIVKKALKQKTIEAARLSLAFAIAKSIGKKGTKPTHFVDEVVNDGRLQLLAQTISKEVNEEIIIGFNKAA